MRGNGTGERGRAALWAAGTAWRADIFQILFVLYRKRNWVVENCQTGQFFGVVTEGKKEKKNGAAGAAGAAQRRAAPLQAAEQVRDFKCYFWFHGFAPYFGIASGVGRFRGPGGRAGAGRPQGRGTSAAPELTTLPHHILLDAEYTVPSLKSQITQH